MEKNEEHLKNLSEIRSLMERSSKFISLSGLSGIFAGITALAGAAAAFICLNNIFFSRLEYNINVITFLLIDGLIVLILQLVLQYFSQQGKQKNKICRYGIIHQKDYL